MNSVLIVAGLIMLAVFTAMVAIYRWLSWTRAADARLNDSFSASEAAAEKGRRRGLTDQVNKRLRGISFADRLERQLVKADSDMSVAEFLLLRLGLALAALTVGWWVSGYLVGGLLLAIGGWLAPSLYLRWKQGKRSKAFGDQLPDMLSMLVGSLRAGYGLLHAITTVEDEMPDPISTEFGRVVRETALGYSIGDALDHLVERVDNDDLSLIVTAIHVQNEVGGSLAEVLDTIFKTICARIELKNEVQAMTAQQRATGSILSALPFVVGTILFFVNPDYMMGMFQPGWPIFIPIGAVVMVIIGNVVMRMVVRIEV